MPFGSLLHIGYTTLRMRKDYTFRGIFLLALFFLAMFFVPTRGLATGGAFSYTKHGGDTNVDGGVWCPTPPCGVDRSLGGEVTYYYDAIEGGRYIPGECVHCHEPHNSFGGSPPPPENNPPDSTAGVADPYLLFGDNSSELCWYCHENMTLMPFKTGYGYWGFYQARTNYQSSSHGISTGFVWPGTGGGDIYPREARAAADNTKCINCHTPHGIMDADPAAGYDFGTVDGTTYNVAPDPTTTTKEVIPRQLIAREEALCLRCHDADGPANAGGTITTNIKAQVDYLFAAEGSGHPVRSSAYYARHDLQNESNRALPGSGWLLSVGAHAECTDCHNPHVAQGYGSGSTNPQRGTVFQWSAGTTNPNRVEDDPGGVRIGPANYGVWGVSVDAATGAVSGTIESLGSTNYLHELCSKCHSAWAWGDTTGTNTNQPISPSTTKTWAGALMPSNKKMTDVAYQFATDTTVNSAWHPVYGRGRNQPPAGANNAWGLVDATGSCATAGGLSLPDDGTYTSNQPCPGTRTDLAIGTENDLSENFVPPWRSTSTITCVDCHEADAIGSTGNTARGPHGSSRPFILRKLQPGITYTVNDGLGGTITIDYSNLIYWTDETRGRSATTNLYSTAATNADPNNLCLNCHRADVYGFKDVVCRSSSGAPYFYTFPRQPHPADWNSGRRRSLCDPASAGSVGDPPRGIVCMRCHGGGLIATDTVGGKYDALGLIHGAPLDTSAAGGSNVVGRALIGGATWRGYTPGTTTSNMLCSLTDDTAVYNACADGGDNQNSNTRANYDYTPP